VSISNADYSSITGTGEVDAVITVKDPEGAVIGTATVGTNGTWALNNTTGTSGTYTATAIDKVGNTASTTGIVANVAPVDANETLAATENTPFTSVNLLANATDANHDTMAVKVNSISGNTAGAVTVVGGILAVDTNNTGVNNLSAGQKQVVTVNYTVSDGHDGMTTSNAAVTITGVNDAPVLGSAVINPNADLLPSVSASSYGTVLSLPATNGAAYKPDGSTLSNTLPDGGLWVNVTGNNPQMVNPLDPTFSIQAVSGPSPAGGTVVNFLIGPSTTYTESIKTTLTGLTADQKYTIGLTWEEAQWGDRKGGDLAIIVNGTTNYFTEPLSYDKDTWKTATVTFTASSTNTDVTVAGTTQNADYNSPFDGLLAAVVWDAYSASQLSAALPKTASVGVALSTLMPSATDADTGDSIVGYAVTSAASSTDGSWEYQAGDTGAWKALTAASTNNAIFLHANDKVRWNSSSTTYTAFSAVAVELVFQRKQQMLEQLDFGVFVVFEAGQIEPLHQVLTRWQFHIAQDGGCMTHHGDGSVAGVEVLDQFDQVRVVGQIPQQALATGNEYRVKRVVIDIAQFTGFFGRVQSHLVGQKAASVLGGEGCLHAQPVDRGCSTVG
jgi:VCBS repeat-containing protein